MKATLIRYALLILFLGLCSGLAICQTSQSELEKKVNRAVLDSAILYEYLKPIAFNLKKENAQLHKENLALRMTNELHDKKSKQDLRFYHEQLSAIRIKGNKKALGGVVAGSLLTLIIFKL